MRSALVVLVAVAVASAQEKERPYREPDLPDDARRHWAFAAPKRPEVPTKGHPIDAFLLAKLRAASIHPAPEADRRTLLRRLTFDLTGLPPTPAELDDFLKDDTPGAYEKVVDRLLASPHFGERQAQHWLDVVRFAESNGYELDADRPHAWRYRDYVVRSFNADKPYDHFLTEQIAGDLLAKDKTGAEAAELLVATGLHRCGPVHMVSGNVDPEEMRQEKITEIVNGFGSTVLGLTLACTRCHDHKFDPLTQGDYFRLAAFFSGSVYKDVEFATDAEKKQHKEQTAAVLAVVGPIKKQIAEIEAPARVRAEAEKMAKLPAEVRAAFDVPANQRTAEQKKLVDAAKPIIKLTWDEVLAALTPEEAARRAKLQVRQLAEEERYPPPLPTAWAIAETDKSSATFVLKRGDWKRRQSPISAGYVRVMTAGEPEAKSRLDLAKWVTDPKNPLTARVIVNRLWQHHFGRGLVASPNDFGTRGEKPTHPELLDWLACELMEPTGGDGGRVVEKPWTLKRLHRLMVTSSAYKQASDSPVSSEAAKTDPNNHLLWRANRRRLEGEAIRDALLATAGTLNRDVYGPSVRVPLEPEVYDLIFTEDEPVNLWKVTADLRQHTRRSLYLFAKRNVRQPLLEAFDQPDTLGSCAVRGKSTFAPQSLILMNGPLAAEQSKRMAVSLMAAGGTESDWIDHAFRRCFTRSATADETKKLSAFLAEQTKLLATRKARGDDIGEPAGAADGVKARALADVCLTLFNLNEFVYIK
ncbi:MAG: DUF1549 and DUF1553 domain-containing protein [Fimbriiglobus sp.]|jgi:hypothetical protein|nr:DUF1549 and DUF1553 domain-containing protein [Fimbriiglobus sp.]